MNTDNVDAFRERLAMPLVPIGERGAWHRDAPYGWISGIRVNGDDQSPDTNLVLTRSADWSKGFRDPLLDYVVELHYDHRREPFCMTPETAIELGRLLILAGSTAVQDYAENSAFVTQVDVEVGK